jgi:hypothetical protein
MRIAQSLPIWLKAYKNVQQETRAREPNAYNLTSGAARTPTSSISKNSREVK